MDYEKAYSTLFNAITIAIKEIEKSRVITQDMHNGIQTLKVAQQTTEEMFLEKGQG